jgi:hydrogenase maturation protease
MLVRGLAPVPGVTVREFDGEAVGLLDVWEGHPAVVIVDTVRSGAAAGTLHRFDASVVPVPTTFRHSSSHTIGVAEAIELARGLDRLPLRVLVFGVEGTAFDASTTLSPAVADALELLRAEVASAAAALVTPPPT